MQLHLQLQRTLVCNPADPVQWVRQMQKNAMCRESG